MVFTYKIFDRLLFLESLIYVEKIPKVLLFWYFRLFFKIIN